MKIAITDQITMSLKKTSIDSRFGPYNSISEAYAAVGPEGYGKTIAGMPFGIVENDGSVTTYKWTVTEGTEDDYERADFKIVHFGGTVNGIVNVSQMESSNNADVLDVFYLESQGSFGYREGSLYYLNWNNRYKWADAEGIPYSDILYYNGNDGSFYYFDGDSFRCVSSAGNVNVKDLDDGTLVYSSDIEDTSDTSGGAIATEDPYGLQLHCAATEGQMRFVKRARQLTDIKFTPAFNMRRVCTPWLDANRVDIFREGEEYQGIPYSIIQNHYGHASLAVGSTVSLDTFITATMKAGSWQNTKSPGGNSSISGISNSDINESTKAAAFYGVFCSGLWSYAYDVKYCYLTFITSTPGFSLESSTQKVGDWTVANLHSHIRLGDTLLNGTFKAGSTTTYTSNPTHVAVITDVWYNSDGTVYAVEVSEGTTSGRHDYTRKGGKTGGVCRRLLRLADNFISNWANYYVLHYNDFEHIDYKPVACSPVGNEETWVSLTDLPLLPASGNHFLYKKSWWNAQSFSSIALMPTITGTVKVTNSLADTSVDYQCTAGTNVNVTCNAVGTYEAYIYATSGSVTSKTLSCTWRVSDAAISATASSTTSVTFTVTCPDDVDVPFAVSFTNSTTGTNDPFKEGKVKCSNGTYIRNTVPSVSGKTRTYTFTASRPSSSYKYAWVVFKTSDFGQWLSEPVTVG